MKNEINIGLLGFGVVGSGVAKILQNHQEDLRHKLGASVSIKKVLVKDLYKKRDTSFHLTYSRLIYKQSLTIRQSISL